MPTPPPRFGLPEVGSSVLFAASGPGVARAIGEAELIGWLFGGISIAIATYGWRRLRHRSFAYRFFWLVAPLALHPRFWLDAFHGDAGARLCFWAPMGTLILALFAAVAIARQHPAVNESRERRCQFSGGLGGAAVGLLIGALILDRPVGLSGMGFGLAVMVPVSASLLGIMIGGLCARFRTEGFRFRVRTLLLLPIVLAPVLIGLLPVLPYEWEISASTTFRFIVVDNATGQPVPNATVQVVHPGYALDDKDQQGVRVTAGADGSAEYFLYAKVHGREGLLGRTETITYNPWMIRVEAPGYALYSTSLAGDPPIRADRLTDLPLNLAFPPPPSATIRLSRTTSAAGSAEDQAKPGRLAPWDSP